MAGSVHINFSEAPSREPVPDDRYLLEVAAVDQAKSSTKQEPMLKMRWKIIGGEYDGRVIFNNLMLVGDGLGITKDAFAALFGETPDGDYDLDQLVGMRCEGKVTSRVYKVEDGGDGEPRNQISRYYQLGTPQSGAGGEEQDVTKLF